MKALEDALAAADFAVQFKMLEAIPEKEFPELLEAVRNIRETYMKEYHTLGRTDGESRREEIQGKFRCLEAAAVIGHQSRKKLPTEFGLSNGFLETQETLDFLVSKQPAWLASLFSSEYEKSAWSRRSACFSHEYRASVIVRYLEAGGIPTLPEGHSYYAALPESVAVQTAGRIDLAKQFLRENPGIVTRDLHFCIRLTARKGAGSPFHLNQPHRYFGGEDGDRLATLVLEEDFSMMKAVGELCAEGVFDHKPILQTIIETLVDAERELEARGVLRVHEQLAPTPAQCLDLQTSYFTLLASQHKSLVKFGIETISGFRKLPGFDAGGFIDRLAPVFTHDSNPLQIAALKLIKDVVTDQPRISGNVPDSIASALLNPNPKVQSAVLAVLKSLPASRRDRISEAISAYADRILSSLKPEFAKWVSDNSNGGEASPLPVPESHPEIGELMQPISAAAELAFVANELLNRDLEPMRFEQFLDGLARYAAENRALLADTFRPMQKRALNFSAGRDTNGGDYPNLLVFSSRLVLLLGPNPPEPGDSVIEIPPPPGTAVWPAIYAKRRFRGVMEFARSRIGELLNGIRERRNLPLLALPEFDLGFISPRTLLERFECYKESGLAPGHFDFIQAIARCHLDGFVPGSIELPSSDDETSRVLRFLFSGEIHGSMVTPSWWLTAARTREPLGDFSQHPQLGSHHDEHSHDWCLPAAYRSPPSMRYHWHDWTSPLLPELNHELPVDHLYPLQHGSIISTYGRYGSDLRWRYSFTPGLLDAVVAQDLQYTHHEAELTEKTAVNAASAVMSELAKRRLPLRHTLQVHLLMALNSPGRAEREAGIDLFIQASGDRRLGAAVPGLGEIFSKLMSGDPDPENGVLQLSRLIPSLRQLSTQGSRIQVQLRDILLRGLESPPLSLPKGLPSLLELLLDLVLAHPPGRSIDLNTAWGGMLDGKSKSLATRISKAGTAE